MNAMLIIGGLFAIALLALVGLVFALRSAPRKATPTELPAPRLSQNQEGTTHENAIKRQEEEEEGESLEVTEGRLPAIRNRSRLSAYSGQFHEFAIELRILHRQVQEIEHRLGMLSEIMDRIEQTGNGRTFIEEEPHSTQHPSQAQQ